MFLIYRFPFFPLFLFSVVWFLSCEPEEEKIDFSPGLLLNFSTDTVQFDTVFAGDPAEVRNITKRLVVYNPHDKALQIASIQLSGGNSSPFELFINGRLGTLVTNQTILGGDSLLLLVNVSVDPLDEDTPFLVKDSIVFEVNNRKQDVKLVAYGQDAHFIPKGTLACGQEWSGLKAYVLKDTVWINEGCKLIIQKGTKVYFNNDAALMVAGQLHVFGEKEERVLFSNSRLDIKDEIGLWAGIHFLPESNNNEIHFADIRNTATAVFLESNDEDTLPDLTIANTRIENAARQGIYAKNADLHVYNSLVNSTVGPAVENIGGGNYTYEHCTLVDYNTMGFFTQDAVVVFSDTTTEEEDLVTNPLKVKLYNNIIWSGGSLPSNSELQFLVEGENFSLDQGHNLIRSSEESQDINSNILEVENGFPEFIGVIQYNYQLDTLSPAIDAGKDIGILRDLEGKERDENPDIGAYEYVYE